MKHNALLNHIATLHARNAGAAVAAVHRALLVRNWLTGTNRCQLNRTARLALYRSEG